VIAGSLLWIVLATTSPAVSAVAPDSAASAAASPDSAARVSAADSLAFTPAPVLTVPETVIRSDRVPATERLTLTSAAGEATLRRVAGAPRPLDEALASIAGVHSSDYGGLGAYSTVSIRGLPSNQAAFLIDGLPLGTASGATVDLSAIPAAAIDRIQVYRGSAPLMLGTSSPAGAVNLITRPVPRQLGVLLEHGPEESWRQQVDLGARGSKFEIGAFASYFTTRGNFVYRDRNGTDLNPRDDGDSLAVNNRRDEVSALAQAAWMPARRWRLDLHELYFHRARGVSGTASVPAPNPRLRDEWSRTSLSVARVARSWEPQLKLAGAIDALHSYFEDTKGQLGVGRWSTQDQTRGDVVTFEIGRPEKVLPLILQAQASLRRDAADLHNAYAAVPSPPESRRLTRGATLDLELRPLGNRLVLHGAQRWERLEDHLHTVPIGTTVRATDVSRELVTPQIGARLELFYGLAARANWTAAQRAPEFGELFGNQGTVLGNPALTPEKVETRDAGLSWHASFAGMTASLDGWLFNTHADDLIGYVRASANAVRAMNISRMVNQGQELSAAIGLAGGATLSGAGTWQAARDRGNAPGFYGRKIPLRPDRELDATLAVPWRMFSALVGLHDMDADYTDRSNRQPVPRRTLWNAALTVRPPGAPFHVSLDVRNLTDQAAYDVAGYPLPGRTVFVSLDWRHDQAGSSPNPGEQP